MNASLIAVYMKPDTEVELESLEKLVHGGGYALRNPQTGHVTLVDDEGEFHVVERDALAAGVSQRQDIRLQFWESKWVDKYPRDLYCRLVFKEKAVVVELGELPQDSDALWSGVWSFFRAKLDDDHILGLVVDRRGVTEEYADWDAFFLDGKTYDGPCPDVLCVRKVQEQLLPTSCASHHRYVRPHHIIVMGPGGDPGIFGYPRG